MKEHVKSGDIYRLHFVSSPQMTPRGDKIIYVKKRADKKDKCYYSNLHRIDIPSGNDSDFTAYGKHLDSMPRISPDGSQLVFLRIKDGIPSLQTISMHGGESRELCDLPKGELKNMKFSPDGKRLALLFARKKDHIPYEDNKPKEPVCRKIDDLFYRLDGHGFIDEEPAQLYMLRASGGKPKKVSDAPFDIANFSWSGSGDYLAYTTVDKPRPELHMDEEDIFLLRTGDQKVSKLNKPAGPAGFLTFSPDDRVLYFSGHFNPHYSWGADNMDIHALDLETGKLKNLSGGTDRSTDMLTLGDITPSFVAQEPVISEGKMYFTLSSEGANPLYALDLASGDIETVLEGPECVIAYSAAADGRKFALHLAQMERPDEIWLLDLREAKRLVRMSFTNDKYLEKVDFNIPRKEKLRSGDVMIDTWVLLPPDFDERKSYPMILNIHGGPRTQYGYTWFHEMHVFAAAGYVTVYSNPRGSQGYGKAFADAITGKWGQPAFDDLMAVTEAMAERDWVDAERLYVTGGSYGGYMTNWIVSQTGRFRAAVSQRSISDLGTFFGTSDIGWDLIDEFGSLPWEHPECYAKWSPLSYLTDISTPLMLIHSENDLRCPMEQAERLYAPLKFMDRDVRLVRFPESSHGLSRGGRPDRRIERLELILEWFGAKAAAGEKEVPPAGVHCPGGTSLPAEHSVYKKRRLS